MNGFTYHNIFQTKGLEYIIIIAFLLILIPYWFIINRHGKLIRRIQTTLGTLRADILKIPQGILYSRNHTWAHLEKSGIAEVGLDDLLLHLAGEVKIGYHRDAGDQIKKGELLMEVVNNGKVLNIFSPISGKVMNTNPRLEVSHALIASDPYNDGWIYRIEPSDWKSETNSLYSGTEANNWFRKELDRFKDFIAVSMGKNLPETSMIILQEGGELRDHPLSELPEEVWQDFQKEFLNN